MMGEWVKVYDLMEDTETIQLVQRATLNTKEFGLEPDVALYGSDEWWRAVDDGRIATHSVSGTISRVYMSGHGDWPEFEVDSGGEKTRWTRVGDQSLYEPGRPVKVEYVLQKLRTRVLGELEQKEVLRIFIER
jgi:hypothetical protein